MPELRLSFAREDPSASADSTQRAGWHVVATCDDPAVARLIPAGGRPFTSARRTWDASDVRWYLEDYVRYPVGGFRGRAADVERKLREGSDALLTAALGSGASAVVADLLATAGPHYLTIDAESSAILSLPWELASTAGRSLLERGVSVRRRPLQAAEDATEHPVRELRVLLVVSRPEEPGYLDHWRTAAVLDACARSLAGGMAVDLCVPATLEPFEEMLARASEQGRPYGVIHFDGHGDYNAMLRRGEICFERAPDAQGRVGTDPVPARVFAALLRRYPRPALLVLEACQTAQVTPSLMGAYSPLLGTKRELEMAAGMSSMSFDLDAAAGLADALDPGALRDIATAVTREGLGSLLEESDLADVPIARSCAGAALGAGVEAIVGMSHSVHVDATEAFMRALYGALASDRTVAAAVDLGRFAMKGGPARHVPSARSLQDETIELADWFVPQLYQSGEDVALEPLASAAQDDAELLSMSGYGKAFLAGERRIRGSRVTLLRGLAGTGKTRFARALASWFSRTGEFPDGIHWLSLETPAADLPAVGAELASWLAGHAALVVIDDAERAVSWETEPPPGWADHRLPSLARECLTSAEPFAGRLLIVGRLGLNNPLTSMGIEAVDLPGLDRPSAANLLRRRLAAAGKPEAWSDLSEEARLDLLARLGGNPGAIETAAAQWPEAAPDAGLDDVDDWMTLWASRVDGGTNDDLGIAAGPLRALSKDARETLAVLGQVRGGFSVDLLSGLQPPTSQGLTGVLEEWAQWGLVELSDAELGIYRFHPWLPYRVAQPPTRQAGVSEAVASRYLSLFTEIETRRAVPVPGYPRWLDAQWGTLRLHRGRASTPAPARQTLGVGLLLDELLASNGLDEPRLRLLRGLDEGKEPGEGPDALSTVLRLRICDYCLGHNQRNDAVSIADATLVELDGTDVAADPSTSARTLSGLAAVLREAGYLHAATRLYCRACAVLIGSGRAREPRRPESFQLAQCFGQLHEALAVAGLHEQAWPAARRQHMVSCAALGGGMLTLEPFVRFAQTLVGLRQFEAAEALFTTLLADSSSLGDRVLPLYLECRGDLLAWRRRFDESAQSCTRALQLYERQREPRHVIACHRNMAAICLQTGRMTEARSWLGAALDMSWQRADADWAAAVLALVGTIDSTTLQALAAGGLSEPAAQLRDELEEFHLDQQARLRGLQEYRAQADAWVSCALGMPEEDSPTELPRDFDVAVQVVGAAGGDVASADRNERSTTSADQLLDEALTPSEPQAANTYVTSMLAVTASLQT